MHGTQDCKLLLKCFCVYQHDYEILNKGFQQFQLFKGFSSAIY